MPSLTYSSHFKKMPIVVTNSRGENAHPGEAVTPILLQLEPGLYKIIGTGFYITRYGLFLTAKHVVEDLTQADGTLRNCLTWHLPNDSEINMRQIKRASIDRNAPLHAPDIAVCQADNFSFTLMNERIGIVVSPPVGSIVGTYAYPENELLDFRDKSLPKIIRSDSFEGVVIEHVKTGPFLRYPHIRTSIDIRSGASGGPAFVAAGHAFAVNCRGGDLLDGEYDVKHESTVVPVTEAFGLAVPLPDFPADSWEAKQLQVHGLRDRATLGELVACGHVTLHPSK